MGNKANIIGDEGEKIAKNYLLNLGYKFIKQNFYSKFGEIDLVMTDKAGTLVFVEVKTYKPKSLLHPLEAITKTKINKLLKTARYYLTFYGKEDQQARFDIMIIEENQVKQHIESAF